MPLKKGRPRIEVNWDEFDKLCEFQCTLREIAQWFGCTEDTIQTRVKEKHGVIFSVYSEQKRSKGKLSLRRKQLEIAMDGNVTMLIWLGKQYLEQSDKQEVGVSGTVNCWLDVVKTREDKDKADK